MAERAHDPGPPAGPPGDLPGLLPRRQLLALAAAAGGALLAGCRPGRGPGLWAVRGELPPGWAQALPSPWQLRQLQDPAALLTGLQATDSAGPALVALADGWATSVPRQRWQPLPDGQTELQVALGRLAPWAAPVSRLFASADQTDTAGQAVRAFPWAYSPWVIALRSRPDLASQVGRGWPLLLHPSLQGRLVLPSSPRVCIELMGGDFARVRQLRRQALAFNDRDGLNLLLSGAADAAVLPLRPLVPLLRRDPRLQLIWPTSGAPLSWQLLLQPARGVGDWPGSWLDAVLQPPLLAQLLAAGWVPPLPPEQLAPVVARFPAPLRPLLAPDPALLARCWSLPPLDARQRLALQTLWDAAAP